MDHQVDTPGVSEKEAEEIYRVEDEVEEKKENELDLQQEEIKHVEHEALEDIIDEKKLQDGRNVSTMKTSSSLQEKTKEMNEKDLLAEEIKENELDALKQVHMSSRNPSDVVDCDLIHEENLNVQVSVSQEKMLNEHKEKKDDESKLPQQEQMNTRSQITETDSDLITPENFEQVEVPNFDENVQFSPIVKLVNPFKSETKDDSGDSCDNTTTSPRSHGKDNFEKSIRDYNLPTFSNSLGYTNYLEQNQVFPLLKLFLTMD